MSSIYKGVLTNNGKALIAQATTANRVGFSHIAIGDGNGSVPTPSDTRTALVREKHRLALNSVNINPSNRNQIICEAIIPSNVGGWTIRELGLYAGSTMVVHSNYPATYKPTQTEGGARELVIRMVINVQSADVIALTLNDSLIYATREWVETNFVNHHEVINNLTSTEINKPLSANQGKVLEDKKLDKTTIFTVEGNNKVYRYHDVAMFNKRTEPVTGVIVLKLPTYFTTMYMMTLQGFNYDHSSSWSAEISAYQYTATSVIKPSITIHGKAPFDQVRFASKNGSHYILFGDTNTVWRYPNIHVKDVLTHYVNQQHWATGYEFSLETDLSTFQILATPPLYGTPRALSAEKLVTPRQLSISGDATATANFDGSANANLALTLANTGVTAGNYQSVTVDNKGRVTAGLNIVNGLVTATTATGTANQATTNNNTYLNLVTRIGTTNSSAGSSIKITGQNGVTVSSDTNGNLLIGGDLVNHINNNDANKPASAWLTNYLHLNKLGKAENAVSATKLQTPRTINGVTFDGTQDITISALLHFNGYIRTEDDLNNALLDGTYQVVNYAVAGLYSYGLLRVFNALNSKYNGTMQLYFVQHRAGRTEQYQNGTIAFRIWWNNAWGDWRIVDQVYALNNTLTSTSQTQALTAAQGKVLNDSKANINHTHTTQQLTDFNVRKLSATENLNQITVAGLYGQDDNVNASAEKNYPENLAGALLVMPSAYGWLQEYTVYSNGHKYVRNRTAMNENSWSIWFRIDGADWNDVRNKPTASLTQAGITQLNSAVNSNLETQSATPKAVKTAYDKAVEAEKKALPIGSVVAFPKEISNPVGFLLCNGTNFAQATYPDLYRALGNKTILPQLTRSDVGQLSYFPSDTIPDGWLECNGQTISQTVYPGLYAYLGNKYGENGKLPDAEDCFIRNASNGLTVGQKQKASLIVADDTTGALHSLGFSRDISNYQEAIDYLGLDTVRSTDYNNVKQTYIGLNVGHSDIAGADKTDLHQHHFAGAVRPKSIVFKLCIKARNSFDDVQFWIKAYGEVVNVGQLDASKLANDLRNHTHTVAQISDFAQGVRNLIQRKNYSATLTPTHNSFRTQTINITGSVEVLPDGRIIQRFTFVCPVIYFHRYGLSEFYREKLGVTSFTSDDTPLLELPLWTAMPNKVQEARIHLSSNLSHYAFGEALEWAYDWDSILNQHVNIKDKAYFALRRFGGSQDEPVTFSIVVEGY